MIITIREFVLNYRSSDEWMLENDHLNQYAGLTFPQAVVAAGSAWRYYINHDAGGVIEHTQHSHIRMAEYDLRNCARALLDNISDLAAAADQGFEPLRQKIEEITSQAPIYSTGNGPGPLYWFDTAEAIGMGGARGLRPDFVYLAGNGPKDCAKLLGTPGAIGRPWLDVAELPSYFHHLEPWEVETCMCAVARLHRLGRLSQEVAG
jgi:hypothetical protein